MADIETIFGKGGAMEALLQAHDQKLVRYLGITVHYANCVTPHARRLPAKASLGESILFLFPPVPCRLNLVVLANHSGAQYFRNCCL
jgi:hypothetical protein